MSQPVDTQASAPMQGGLRKIYRAAKEMVARGWVLFPLHRINWSDPPICGCGDLECTDIGKHPAVTWSTDRVSDAKGVLDAWFDYPYRGIGLVTGAPSGVWVLDIDLKGNGAQTLSDLESANTPLPKTVTAITGSGGKHYYFKYPGPGYRNTARRLGPGLDTRGDGGYVVVPPSAHKSSNDYLWENSPDTTELAEAPEWLLALVRTELSYVAPPVLANTYTRGTPEDARLRLQFMKEHPLVQWALENPNDVLWDMWRGLAQNLAAVSDGHEEVLEDAEEFFHALSEGHRDYRRSKTAKVFQNAAQHIFVDVPKAGHGGPLSFTKMCEQPVPAGLVSPDDGSNLAVYARRRFREAHKETTPPPPPPPAPSTQKTTPAPAAPTTALARSPAAPAGGNTPVTLNVGVWTDAEYDRFFFDEQKQTYRYLTDPADPLSLSGSRSSASIAQILTSDFRMPKKAALRVMEQFKVIGSEIMDPALPPGAVPVGARYAYNTYADSSIKPVAGNWDNVRKLLLLLVGGDGLALEYFLDWLAEPLQSIHLHKKLCKLRTAVALSGQPGAGKGTLEKLLKLIYGDRYIASVGQEILDSPYQGVLANRLFVVADEVKAHDRAAVERLKRLITAPQIDIEEKYVSRTTLPNWAQYLFTTNDDIPVRVERGDRRFSVFFTSDPDVTVTDAVWKDIEGAQTEVAAFFEHMLSRKITSNLDRPFDNAAREEVKELLLRPHEAFAKEVREFGLRYVALPWLERETLSRPRMVTVTVDSDLVASATLQDIYREWLRTRYPRTPAGNAGVIISRLRKLGLVGECLRRDINGVTLRVYSGIPLDPVGEDPVEATEPAALPATTPSLN